MPSFIWRNVTRSELAALHEEIRRLRRELAEARADHEMVTELYNAAVADYDQAFRNGLEKAEALGNLDIDVMAKSAFEYDWPKDNWDRLGDGYHQNRYRGMVRAAIRSAMEGKAK